MLISSLSQKLSTAVDGEMFNVAIYRATAFLSTSEGEWSFNVKSLLVLTQSELANARASQVTFSCSNSTIGTLEKGVKHIQI